MSSRLGAPIPIAFCVTDLDPGGAERALVQIVTRLDRQRWSPTVFCLSGRGVLADLLETAGIPTVCLGARGAAEVAVVWRLARELRKLRPALLQTFLFHANIAGRIAGCLARVPRIVAGIRVAEKRTRTHAWLDRFTRGLVDYNVCVSAAVAEFAWQHSRLHPDKTQVIPNGVDVSAFADAEPASLISLGIRPGAPVMVAVGRLDPQKGLEDLISAMERQRDKNWHLLIVGEGPLRDRLQDDVTRRGLTGRVHLAGWRRDVPQLLRAADFLVLPSLWEGMPNAVLEAMAAGLPVIATRVEGIDELVIPGETGLIVAPQAPHELAEALDILGGDSELRRRLGQAGQQRVRQEFTWEKVVAAYERLYRFLLS